MNITGTQKLVLAGVLLAVFLFGRATNDMGGAEAGKELEAALNASHAELFRDVARAAARARDPHVAAQRAIDAGLKRSTVDPIAAVVGQIDDRASADEVAAYFEAIADALDGGGRFRLDELRLPINPPAMKWQDARGPPGTVDGQHVGGYRIDLEDRAGLKAMSRRLPEAFRKAPKAATVDPREFMRVEDQGQVGSCQGQTISSCLEHQAHAAGFEGLQLSRLYAYLASQQIDGLLGSDTGSTIYAGVKLARDTGLPLEKTLPYPDPASYPRDARGLVKLSREAAAEAETHRIANVVEITSAEEAYEALSGGMAITIGIKWYQGIERNGWITEFRPGRSGGGHAIAILGYDEEGNFWLLNSWSKRWGIDGWAKVQPQAMRQMLSDSMTQCYAVSDMPNLQPRRLPWADYTPAWREAPQVDLDHVRPAPHRRFDIALTSTAERRAFPLIRTLAL